ncbi:MAG: helix-turn-helix domain-containing protein [Eubacterium sp.]|nr:helix-turn-helix domain-containing protein [Eubacterium sp.]
MKLSIWIFTEWLKEYRPELQVKEGGLNIETVRLFSSDSPEDDTCLYIGRLRDLYVQGNDDVICTNKNDLVLLHTSDLDEVMNRILDAFEFYQRWNVRMLEAISSDIRPSEILDIAGELIKEPLYLLDSNQYTLALSTAFGHGTVNPLWDMMLDNGTADLAFLTRLNREYPEHMTNRGLYKMVLPFIPNPSYNYNMFFRDKWIGLCCMIERDAVLPQSTIDLFQIFCQDIELWYQAHSQEQESLMIDSLFREALMSETGAGELFRRRCQLRFHTLSDEKYILAVKVPFDQALLASHLCKELNLTFPNVLAILHQQYICVLYNLSEKKNKGQALQELTLFLKSNNCSAGCSTPFIDFSEIRYRYREAVYAAGHNSDALHTLFFFDEAALSCALEEIRDHMTVNLIHPSVLSLLDYDRIHHTEFARTLQTYLMKERSQSRTAEALHLHRNTLTYRLQRIRELLNCDLDNDDTRLHLLLSFRFLPASD